MTTQEQLDKIIKSCIEKLSKEEEYPYILDIDFYDIKKIASAILSAMRIDKDKIKVILDKYAVPHIKIVDGSAYAYINEELVVKEIASHVQEIIKFEEVRDEMPIL